MRDEDRAELRTAGVLAGGHRRRGQGSAGGGAASVGVLTGGRLTLEDAYAYPKFARAVLGTNNIDFRARPHSDEGGRLPGPCGRRHRPEVTYSDLETPARCCWSAFEPEEEAG